jgi:hypothetical protein
MAAVTTRQAIVRLDSHMVILAWRQSDLKALASVALNRRSDITLFNNFWKCKSGHRKRKRGTVCEITFVFSCARHLTNMSKNNHHRKIHPMTI